MLACALNREKRKLSLASPSLLTTAGRAVCLRLLSPLSHLALNLIFPPAVSVLCLHIQRQRKPALTFRQAINFSQLQLCISCREPSFPVLQSSHLSVREQLGQIYCTHSCMFLHVCWVCYTLSSDGSTADWLLIVPCKSMKLEGEGTTTNWGKKV